MYCLHIISFYGGLEQTNSEFFCLSFKTFISDHLHFNDVDKIAPFRNPIQLHRLLVRL